MSVYDGDLDAQLTRVGWGGEHMRRVVRGELGALAARMVPGSCPEHLRASYRDLMGEGLTAGFALGLKWVGDSAERMLGYKLEAGDN